MIKLISKLTNKFLNRDLKINKNIPFLYLIGIITGRVFMLLRRPIKRFFINKNGRGFFIGKKVTIRCVKKITVGKSVTFQDYVFIDALSKNGVLIGDDVSIGMRTVIKVSGSLEKIGKGFSIGNNSCLGNDCYVGASGGVEIGNNVAIGQNVRFHSENHGFKEKDKLICEQGVTNKGITIGNDCWIGAGVVFLDGVKINDGAVIGANSLVTNDIPSYSIAAGTPAKVIGMRE